MLSSLLDRCCPDIVTQGVRWTLVGLLSFGAPGFVGASDAVATAAVPTGNLSVVTHPVGAAVYVDGELRGTAPLELKTVEAGDHRVKLVKDGYLDHSRVLNVQAGGNQSVDVELTANTADSGRMSQDADQGQGQGQDQDQDTETDPSDDDALKLTSGSGGGVSKTAVIVAATGAAVGVVGLATGGEGNTGPGVGSITASPPSGLASSTAITFTAEGANNPGGDAASYAWDFGDGNSATTQSPSHTYSNAGVYGVSVTVSAGEGSATANGTVTIKSLDGSWNGIIVAPDSVFPFHFAIVQNGNSVTGSYRDPDGPGTVVGQVSSGGAVNLTYTQVGNRPFTYRGTVDADVNSINGTIFGLSFTMSR